MNSTSKKYCLAFTVMLILSVFCYSTPAQTLGACNYKRVEIIASGSRTAHVLAVDLNRDGALDVIGTNQGGMNLTKGTISVALGAGNGSFYPITVYTLGDAGPYETTAADFNGDGYIDLAVELFGTSDRTIIGAEIDVFINKGDGTFHPFVAYATGKKPRAVISADLNKDGKQDLIVANSIVDSVGVLLGVGDGTFGPRHDYPAGDNPHGVVVTDLDNDGNLDVAICNNSPMGSINVLMGKGNGSLENTVQYEAGEGTFSLDSGDMNGDGYADIVTANERANSVSVLINTGSGSFKKPSDYAVSGGPSGRPVAVTLGDLQGDGKLDVLASVCNKMDPLDGGVTNILYGNGDGTLQSAATVATGNGSYDAAIADFDDDGTLDIVSAVTTGSLVIMKGTCN